MNVTTMPTISVSIKIGPQDERCRYWAKLIRATDPLDVLPSACNGANDVPGSYLRNGEDELFHGDVLIEGEALHHRQNRGWRYEVYTCASDGTLIYYTPATGIKAQLKAAGLDPKLLPGSGDVAACIRIAYGIRAGLLKV